MGGPARARIVERPEDIASLQPVGKHFDPGDVTSFSEVIAAPRLFVLEGVVDVAPLMRALNEVPVPFSHAGDTVVMRATQGDIAKVRATLLSRPNPVADSIVGAIDAALAGWMRRPRDVVWPGGRLGVSRRALLMGIVNVTPDSFSDGGRFLDPGVAVKHALALVEEGADILDIGGESTRPGAEPVDADEERRRVVPVIEELRAVTQVPISIDTTKASVARAALDAGAQILNDVSAGRFDDGMFALAAEREVPLVLMHMLGEPRTMQADPSYRDVVAEVAGFLAERAAHARAAGVKPERIVIDPGFGFGKTREHNLLLLRRLRELCCLGYPVLAGTSRKSFIGTTLDLPVEERLEGTAATVALAIANGASIVRVHDAGPMRRVAGMVEAVLAATEPGRTPGVEG